jgi:hypothetical protein
MKLPPDRRRRLRTGREAMIALSAEQIFDAQGQQTTAQ